MGKFNLNQILNDASRKAAAGGEPKARPAEAEIKKISVYDLVPSEDNFYSMREIDELKTAIEVAGKVLQNLVVVPLEAGKYKVIAGHRRRLASLALVEEGKPQYEFLPCAVEPNEAAAEDQEVRDGFLLIVTNSQREKTAWDRIEEVRYMRELLEKAKTKPRFVEALQNIVATVFSGGDVQFDGTRDFLAKVLHTSPAQIGRYDAIIRNLQPAFAEELRAERINVSAAYELSGLTAEQQAAAFREYQRTGAISIKDARAWKPDTAERAEPAPPPPPPVTAEPAERDTPPAVAPSRPAQDAQEAQEARGRVEGPPARETPTEANGGPQEGPKEPPAPEAPAEEPPEPAPEPPAPAEPPASSTPAAEPPETEAERAVKLINDFLSYCMSKAEIGEPSRDWDKDVHALLYVLNRLEEG